MSHQLAQLLLKHPDVPVWLVTSWDTDDQLDSVEVDARAITGGGIVRLWPPRGALADD